MAWKKWLAQARALPAFLIPDPTWPCLVPWAIQRARERAKDGPQVPRSRTPFLGHRSCPALLAPLCLLEAGPVWRGLVDVGSRVAHGECWAFMERPLQVKASHIPSFWPLTTLLRAASYGETEAKVQG